MVGLKRLYHWMLQHVHKPYAEYVLMIAFCAESCIFPIPVDPLLIIYCLENRVKSWYYATIATMSSVIGGLIGYGIGFGIWHTVGSYIVGWIFSPEQFQTALAYYKKYEAIAVLIAAFTPLPYKVITVSAGFCSLPLLPFILYSIIGRGARFYLVAGIIVVWGQAIKQYIDRYFNIFVVLFSALVIIAFRCIV